MTLKDFIRIIRRRIAWFCSTFFVIAGIYAAMAVSEPQNHAVTVAVTISAPDEITLLTQSPGRLYPTTSPSLLSTWISRIVCRDVQSLTSAELLRRHPGKEEEIAAALANAKVAQVGQTMDANIVITARDPHLASEIANVLAANAELYSKKTATEDVGKAIEEIQKNVERNRTDLSAIEDRLNMLQNDSNTLNPERKATKLEDTIASLEDTIAEMRRKIERSRVDIEKIHTQKAIATHFSKEFLPQSTALRSLPSNAITEKLRDKLFDLRLHLNNLTKRYLATHPDVVNTKNEIRDTESLLTKVREELNGESLDKREFEMMNENDIALIEIKSLENSLAEAKETQETLSKQARAHKTLSRDYEDIFSRNSQLVAIKERLSTFKEASSGYVKVGILSKPEDAFPVDKRTSGILPIALIMAVIISTGIAYLVEFLDTTIKTDFDVKHHLNYPLLGTIPLLKKQEVYLNQEGCAAIIPEIFDTIATMIAKSQPGKPIKTIIVTSANPREGKTTISINLAIAITKQQKNVVLIDGDLRIPAIHTFLNVSNTIGLTEIIGGNAPARDILRQAIGEASESNPFGDAIQDCGIPRLKVITSGERPASPHSLLETQRLAEIFEALGSQFDYIIVDSPPLLMTGDALKMSAVADATIFVIEAGKIDQKEALWAKHLLASINATVSGVILNKSNTPREQYYYYHYGYHNSKR